MGLWEDAAHAAAAAKANERNQSDAVQSEHEKNRTLLHDFVNGMQRSGTPPRVHRFRRVGNLKLSRHEVLGWLFSPYDPYVRPSALVVTPQIEVYCITDDKKRGAITDLSTLRYASMYAGSSSYGYGNASGEAMPFEAVIRSALARAIGGDLLTDFRS